MTKAKVLCLQKTIFHVFCFCILSVLVSCSGCHSQSVKSYVKEADTLVAAGKPDDAVVLYQKAIQQYPKESVLYINQATLLRKAKKYPKAIRNYEAVLNLNPDSFWPYIGLGRIYILQKKHDAAKEILKKGLKKIPGNASVLFHLGLAYYESNNGEVALEYFNQALDAKYKNSHKIYYYRGLTFERLLHNIERAKMDYQSYLMMDHPDDKTEVKNLLEQIDSSRYEF